MNVPGVPTVKVALFGAGDRRRRVDHDGEALRRVRQRAVGRRERHREGSALRRRARQQSGRRQREARSAARRLVTLTVGAGKPVITTWNVVPAVFSDERRRVGARDRRRLVDRQREGLRGVGADAVGRGERQVVDAAGARVGRPAQQAGGRQRDPGRQRPRGHADRGRREAGHHDVERARAPDREGRVALALVIAGAALTTTVKACVAFGSVPLVAVSVTGKDPLCVGVPDSSPAADSVRPVGSTPAGDAHRRRGMPVITTWNVVPAVFSRNVAVLALVIAGA